MARRWSPKYKARCSKCDWTGRRTGRMMSKPCPKCGGYPVERVNESTEPMSALARARKALADAKGHGHFNTPELRDDVLIKTFEQAILDAERSMREVCSQRVAPFGAGAQEACRLAGL